MTRLVKRIQVAHIIPLTACAVVWGCGGGAGEDFFDEPAAIGSAGAGPHGGLGGSTSGKGGATAGGSGGTGQSGSVSAGTSSSAGSSASGGGGTGGSGTGGSGTGGSGATGGDGSAAAGNAPAAGTSQGGTGAESGSGGAGASAATGGGGVGAGGSAAGMGGTGLAGTAGDGGGAGEVSGGSGGEPGGTGGTSAGGKGGKGMTCVELRQELETALEEAQVCTNAADALPCRGVVDDSCGCQVPVNDPNSAATKHYQALLDELHARDDCTIFCTDLVCSDVREASCLMPVQGNRGQCVARSRSTF